MKYFNNNSDDDTNGGKIGGKICDIWLIFNRLGSTVNNKDRKKITKELY